MNERVLHCGQRPMNRDVDRRQAATLIGAGAACAGFAANPAAGAATQTPSLPEDERFMRAAIAEAAQADMPFGAVIMKNGEILAKGRNLGKTLNDPTAHGEMVAIRRFVAARPAAELKGATLYTSGEPCPMCMGAILWCGFGRLAFAASIEELSKKIGQIMLPCQAVAEAAPFAPIAISGGLLSQEALALFENSSR